MEFDIRNYQSIFLKPDHMIDSSWIEHAPFAFLLVDVLKPSIIVELGVHNGYSFCTFCQAVKNTKIKCLCYGVDNFGGDSHSGLYDANVYNNLKTYVDTHYLEFGSLMKMTFDEAARFFSDNTIDILHIDGLHTYDAVKHDFENWLPKISDKGIVVFHDTTVRREDFGVWKLWDEISKLYPSYNFVHDFGLGIIAVGSNVSDELLSMLRQLKADPFLVTLFVNLGRQLAKDKELTYYKDMLNQKNLEVTVLQKNLEELYKSSSWRVGAKLVSIAKNVIPRFVLKIFFKG